jgi:hypothetical protein
VFKVTPELEPGGSLSPGNQLPSAGGCLLEDGILSTFTMVLSETHKSTQARTKSKADAQKTAVSKLFVMHLCICKILNLPKCIYLSSDPTPILGVIIEISMKQKLGMCKLQVNMSEYKRD